MANLLLSTSIKSEKKLDLAQPDNLSPTEYLTRNSPEVLKPKTSIKNPIISKSELTDKKNHCIIT